MHDRSALGAADLPDAELAELVRRQLTVGEGEPLELLASTAAVAPYDLFALTTAGRYRVRGRARTADGERDFSFYVKVVQSWARTPMFAFVPPELRELALAGLPWEVEPRVYRSDLASRLPDGLSMPTAYAVVELDAESAALWLEEVDVRSDPWDLDRFARAAFLLGRLAASADVRVAAAAGRSGYAASVRGYADGRLAHQVVPALRDESVWGHPLVAGAFDPALRAELLAAADRVDELADELQALPAGVAHGDACIRNLLVPKTGDDLVLIDFGFWGRAPLGFDLGQLVVGEVQVGERPSSELPALEATCVPAYVEGLRREGCDVEAAVVRRAHALQLLLFTGLSALPLEHLDQPPSPELQRIAQQRAGLARFCLGRVRDTSPAVVPGS